MRAYQYKLAAMVLENFYRDLEDWSKAHKRRGIKPQLNRDYVYRTFCEENFMCIKIYTCAQAKRNTELVCKILALK